MRSSAPSPDALVASESALQALKGLGRILQPSKAQKDPVTAMLTRQDFLLALEEARLEAEASRDHLSLLCFELPQLLKVPGPQADKILRRLSSRIWDSAQSCDRCGRLDKALLGIFLPGCGSWQALALAESIVSDVCLQCTALEIGPLSLRASVLVNSKQQREQCRDAQDWLGQALCALAQAAEDCAANLRQRVKLYQPETEEIKETLVLANEKHFLFFGSAQ